MKISPTMSIPSRTFLPSVAASAASGRFVRRASTAPTLTHARAMRREPVRVKVVTQEQRDVAIGGREESRAAVMEQIPLVDRLDSEREALFAERREDGFVLALADRPKRVRPERALALRLVRDDVPEIR